MHGGRDIDLDGHLDLVVGHDGLWHNGGVSGLPGGLSALLGSGDGSFRPPIWVFAESGRGTAAFDGRASVHVADMDGDGRLDILAAGNRSVLLLHGQRDTLFAKQLSTFPAGSGAGWLAAGDLDEDGDTDLVVTNEYAADVSVLLGNGDAEFTRPFDHPVGLNPLAQTATDLNGDGELDLAVANSDSDDISILLGRGNGTFLPEYRYSVGDSPSDIIAADLDGDGRVDLATTNEWSDSVSVLLGLGEGQFAGEQRYPTGHQPNSLAAADLDHDGNPDLIVSSGDTIAILRGRGDGSFNHESRYAAWPQVLSHVAAVHVADLNRDGQSDLVLAASGVHVLLGEVNGAFAQPIRYSYGDMRSIASEDLNGDGIVDLIAVCDGYVLDIIQTLIGRGDGTFAEPTTVDRVPGESNAVVAADLNSDGMTDVAVSGQSGVFVYPGNGNGTLGPAMRYPVRHGANAVLAGDLDRDGDVDLAVTSPYSHEVSVLVAHGNGVFQGEPRYAVGQNPDWATLVDISRDGHLDLLVTNSGSHDVSVLLGAGDGTFGEQTRYGVDGSPGSLVVADFDGDTYLDLAVAAPSPTRSGSSWVAATARLLSPNATVLKKQRSPPFPMPNWHFGRRLRLFLGGS